MLKEGSGRKCSGTVPGTLFLGEYPGQFSGKYEPAVLGTVFDLCGT